MTGFSEEQLDAAVKALSDPERFREAERVVARAAPELQRILAQALQSGGWFAESNEEGLRRALETELQALRAKLGRAYAARSRARTRTPAPSSFAPCSPRRRASG